MSKDVGEHRVHDIERLICAVVAVVSAVLVANVLYQNEGHPLVVFATPMLCLALLVTRSELLFLPLLVVVFGSIVLAELRHDPEFSSWLALGVMIVIAAVARFRASRNPDVRAVSQRLNYTPPSEPVTSSKARSVGQIMTPFIIVVSWFIAGRWCSGFVEFTVNPEVGQSIRSEAGLIPEAYFGLKILFTMSLAFWVLEAVFSNVRFRSNRGEISAMHLRSELWKWSGTEQKMISKQLRRNKTANGI